MDLNNNNLHSLSFFTPLGYVLFFSYPMKGACLFENFDVSFIKLCFVIPQNYPYALKDIGMGL